MPQRIWNGTDRILGAACTIPYSMIHACQDCLSSLSALCWESCPWFELDTQAPSLTAWGVKPRRGSITQEPSVTARRVLVTDVVSGLSICGPCTGQSRPSTSHLRPNLPTLCSWYVFHMYFACNTHVQHMYSMYWVMCTFYVPYVLLILQYMKNTWHHVLVHNIMYCTCTKCAQHVLAVVYLACSWHVL